MFRQFSIDTTEKTIKAQLITYKYIVLYYAFSSRVF